MSNNSKHDKQKDSEKEPKASSENPLDRFQKQIERDIKVIKEYQDHSLASLPKESDDFLNLEKRLYKATAEPLRNLLNLKNPVKVDLTNKQASEWIASLQNRRESLFEQVLLKIDSAVREVISHDMSHDDETIKEIEGEVTFIEHEIDGIKRTLLKLHLLDENELLFLKERVDSLAIHLGEYDLTHLPKNLNERLNTIQQWITLTSAQIICISPQ